MTTICAVSHSFERKRYLTTCSPRGATYFDPNLSYNPDWLSFDEAYEYCLFFRFRLPHASLEKSHIFKVSLTSFNLELIEIIEFQQCYSHGSYSTTATNMSMDGVAIDFVRLFREGFRRARRTPSREFLRENRCDTPCDTDDIQVKYFSTGVQKDPVGSRAGNCKHHLQAFISGRNDSSGQSLGWGRLPRNHRSFAAVA